MKKLIYIILGSIFSIVNSSCSLDETIFDQATATNAVRSEADLDYAVVGAYSNLNSANLFGRDIMYIINPYADDISSTVSFEPGTFGRKVDVNSGTAFFNNVYVRFYETIREAHALLRYVNQVTTSDFNKEKVKGEAYFLRAFCYFNLVQLWGGVPLITETVDAKSDFYQPRASVDEVYALIFSDLEAAAKSLYTRTAQPASEFYRATKGAAQGYLAKAYLTYANYLDLNNRSSESKNYYQKAKEAAEEVISSGQYSLVTDYSALWDVEKEKSNYIEVIFAIPHTRDAANLTVTGEGSFFPAHFLPPSLAGTTGTTTTAGLDYLKIQPWFFEKYTKDDWAGDYRVETTFLSSWIGSNGVRRRAYPLSFLTSDTKSSYAYLAKYKDGKGLSNFGHENDHYLLRLSEIYLIKAEAENEINGPTSEALDAFNKLRERARKADGNARMVPADVSSGLSKEDFRMKIFDERGLEFIGEYHRFFDLIRMRCKDNKRTMYEYQFATFIPSLPAGVPTASGTKWVGGVTQPLTLPPYNSKFLLFPIPANQMGNNPKLVQNPGW